MVAADMAVSAFSLSLPIVSFTLITHKISQEVGTVEDMEEVATLEMVLGDHFSISAE